MSPETKKNMIHQMIDLRSEKSSLQRDLKLTKNISVTLKDLWNLELSARAIMQRDKSVMTIIQEHGIYENTIIIFL